MSFGFYSNNNGSVITNADISPGYILLTLPITSTTFTPAQISSGLGFVTGSLPNMADFSRYSIFLRLNSYVHQYRVFDLVAGFSYTAETSYNLSAGTYTYRFNYRDNVNPTDQLTATIQIIGY
jgi:hypothetical protein